MDQPGGSRSNRWKFAGSFKGGKPYEDPADSSGGQSETDDALQQANALQQGPGSPSVKHRVKQFDQPINDNNVGGPAPQLTRMRSRISSFDVSGTFPAPSASLGESGSDARQHFTGTFGIEKDSAVAELERSIVLLKEEMSSLQKENRRWKSRVDNLSKGGSEAINALVAEVLDENTRLMDRTGQLYEQNEELRRSVEMIKIETARNASQPSQSLAPSASITALETLQQENQRLAEENELLKQGIGERSSLLDQIDLSTLPSEVALEFVKLMTEVEDLQAKMNDLYEEKVSAINDDNIRLVNQLMEENVHLGDELQRLNETLAKASEGNQAAEANLDMMEHMKTEMQRLKDEKQKVMDANVKLTEKNTKLQQENEQLQEAASRSVPAAAAAAVGGAAVGAAVANEDGNIEMVRELTEENSKLIDDLKLSTSRVHDILAVNAELFKKSQELEERLFRAAFQTEDGDAGDEDLGGAPSIAASAGDEDLKRKAKQLEDQAAAAEEEQKQAMVRRMKLQAKGSRLVEQYDHRKNKDTSTSSASGSEPAAPPDTARKREEREMARAALASRIEESRKKREEEIKRKQEEALRKMREQEHERQLEDQMKARYKSDAEDKVRKAYFHYAGKEDVGGFMRFLGYKFQMDVSADSTDEELREAFKKAIIMTHPDRHVNGSMEKKALAEATYTKLQRWMGECGL